MADQSGQGIRQAPGLRQDAEIACAADMRLLDLLPGLVAYFDPELRFTYVNQAYAERRTLSRSDIVGKPCLQIVGEATFSVISPRLAQALKGQTERFDYDLVVPGGVRRAHAQYIPDLGPDGKVRGILVMINEVSARLDLQQRIAETVAMFEDAFSNSPIGMALVDTLGAMIRVNKSFASMLARPEGELVGLNFAEITHPDDMDADLHLFHQVLAGRRDSYKIDKRYLRGDGGVVETSLSVTAMRNPAGEILRFVSQIEDVTEQRQAQRRLMETNAQLSLAMEVVSGGFWHMDVSSQRFETSEGLASYIAGAHSETLDLDAYLRRIHDADRQGADLMPLIEGRIDRGTAEYRLETVQGERWMRCDRKLVRDVNGLPSKIVGMAVDITEERDQLIRTQEQAESDSLTGLFNRRGFEKRFRREPMDSSCGLLLIDLDGFKQINDQLGHDAGDEVLVETAKRLRAAVRGQDMVARLGGDEFVVTLASSDAASVKVLAERIRLALGEAMSVHGRPVKSGCSIGAAWFPIWPADLRQSLAIADAALYQAKAAGRNAWRLSEV